MRQSDCRPFEGHSGPASHVSKLALTTASILFASSFDMETVQHAVKMGANINPVAMTMTRPEKIA
jgi:hypothetical protein